ncbi:hypothetical protein ACQR2L_05065 [Clostridium butyricum]|uniref:hypothetical protein n=1 Tax=Clostridium butyricum TaxID=1492 RepID=UPI003D0EE598
MILYQMFSFGLTQEEMSESVNKYLEDCRIIDKVISQIGDEIGQVFIEEKDGHFHIWNPFAVYNSICSGYNSQLFEIQFKPDIDTINLANHRCIFNEISIVLNELQKITTKKIYVYY